MIKQKLYHVFSLIQTEYVIEILYGLGFFSEIDINFLVDSSLLTINKSNQLEMHGLLRDMGREVVCELSPNHPGKLGGIWLPRDVHGVLNNQTLTEVVAGLALDVHFTSKSLPLSRMRYLNLLLIDEYSNMKELCNEIKVRHVNGKAVCSDKNNTCIIRECQKQNENQDGEGIRTIWPNLLDDCSNLANTFKKTLVQALCKGDVPRLFQLLWRRIFIIILSSSSCRWGTPSAGCLGYLCSQCSK